MARLFAAVRPDDATRALLDQTLGVPRPTTDGVRWVPPEQWHITIGFWPDAVSEPIIEALRSGRWPAVSITLGPVISRMGRDAVVAPASGAEPLAEVVRSLTGSVHQRLFRGHLTLARLKHRGACGVAGARLSTTYRVEEVELVHSELTPSGAVHTTLARWPTFSEA